MQAFRLIGLHISFNHSSRFIYAEATSQGNLWIFNTSYFVLYGWSSIMWYVFKYIAYKNIFLIYQGNEIRNHSQRYQDWNKIESDSHRLVIQYFLVR